MNKIINYIKQSESLGAKYLLIFCCIASFFVTIMFRISQNNMPERLQQTADKILPIKVENGRIVEPDNTVRAITLDLFDNAKANEKLHIFFNTTVDSLDTRKLEPGIYMTRKAFYTVAQNQTRTTYLESSFDIPALDYRPVFKQIINYITIAVFIITAPILFIAYFLLCLFYSWCAGIIGTFLKRKTDFDMRMRLSVAALIPLKLLSYLLSIIGIKLGFFTMFVATLFCLSLFLMQLPEEKKPEQTS